VSIETKQEQYSAYKYTGCAYKKEVRAQLRSFVDKYSTLNRF